MTRFLPSVMLIFLSLGCLMAVAHADEDAGLGGSDRNGVASIEALVKNLSHDIVEGQSKIEEKALLPRIDEIKREFLYSQSLWNQSQMNQAFNALRDLNRTISTQNTLYQNAYDGSHNAEQRNLNPYENTDLGRTLDRAKYNVWQIAMIVISGELANGKHSAAERIKAIDAMLEQSLNYSALNLVEKVKAELANPERGTPVTDIIHGFLNQPKLSMPKYDQLVFRLGISPDYGFISDAGNYALSEVKRARLSNGLAQVREHVVCGVLFGCATLGGAMIFGGSLGHWAAPAAVVALFAAFLKTIDESDTAAHPTFMTATNPKDDLKRNVDSRKNLAYFYGNTINICKVLLAAPPESTAMVPYHGVASHTGVTKK